MTVISFTIDQVPVPKGRPRITRGGHAYTPQKTRSYERIVAAHAQVAMTGKKPFTGALKLTATFYLPIPKSWPVKKKHEAISGAHSECIVADLDNFTKALFDGMNGIVYGDDRQIVKCVAVKRYAMTPETAVIIEGVEV